MNLKKMLLGKNFPEIVTEKDLRIPDEKATIMGWSGRKYWDKILEFRNTRFSFLGPRFSYNQNPVTGNE
jgi:hypothetical protein